MNPNMATIAREEYAARPFVTATFSLVWQERREALRLFWPTLLVALLWLFAGDTVNRAASASFNFGGGLFSFEFSLVALILLTAAFAPAAARWHRHLALDEPVHPVWKGAWSRRHWRYLGKLAAVLGYTGLIAIFITVPLSAVLERPWSAFNTYLFQEGLFGLMFIADLMMTAIIITIATWWACRTFLVLPSVALDGGVGRFSASIHLADEHGGTIATSLVLGVIAPLVAIYALAALAWLAVAGQLDGMSEAIATIANLAVGVVVVLSETVAAVIAVTLLSVFFRTLAGPVPGEVPTGADTPSPTGA